MIIVALFDDGGAVTNCESTWSSKFDLGYELTEPSTWLKQSGTGVRGYFKTSDISIFCCTDKHSIEPNKSLINVASINFPSAPRVFRFPDSAAKLWIFFF